MNNIFSYSKHKTFWTRFLVAGFIIVIYIAFKMITNTYLTIQFDELEPFEKNMPVYYKGFKVGKTRSIKPSKDFKHTYILVVINYSELKLPKNTTAVVKKRDKGVYGKKSDYIELEYPDAPSIYYLKTGSLIKGKSSFDLNTLLSKEVESGKLDDIGDGVNSLLSGLKETSEALTVIFKTVNEILVENRPNLYSATSNLSKTTGELYNVSEKINKSLPQQRLDNTSEDFENTAGNVEEASKNVKEMTEDLNKMIPQINSTIEEINSAACNVNQITDGISKTLQKRLGLMKLLMGKPIDNGCCNR